MSKYTLDDKAAMAASRNVSYGRIQQCLEYGLPLPPLVRSTRWPKGSAHIGEEVLPGDVSASEEQKQDIPKQKTSRKNGSGVRLLNCHRCGTPMPNNQSVHIYVHTAKESWPQGLKFADICPNCARAVLPEAEPLKKEEREPLYDSDGNKIPIRWVGRCVECGKLHKKADGAQVNVERPGSNHPTLYCYLCQECLPAWKAKIKKTTQAADEI